LRTLEQFKEVLSYDPNTGIFFWRHTDRKKIKGAIAGHLDQDGYRIIKVWNKDYKAHRLAFFYSFGRWPQDQIDHINGVRADNRIANLREADKFQQRRNSRTSPLKGAYRVGRRWRSYIRFSNKSYYLGTWDTQEEANQAYAKAAKEYFGEFSCASSL
jgi:hypothetical protein